MDTARQIHEGRNVKCIRKILGIKQLALAIQLGVSQQTISQLEQKETLDVPTLAKVAEALKITADDLRNFNEEATFNIISNNYYDQMMQKQRTEAVNYTKEIPIGRKIESVRRLLGITQTQLGGLLGITKQAVSKIEQTKQIDDEKIKKISEALGVAADAIKNFSEEVTFNIISNTYHHHSSSVKYQLNPIEKIINRDENEKAKASLKNFELLQRFKEIDNLPEPEQQVLIKVISAYLRNFKAKQVYAQILFTKNNYYY